MRSNGNGSRSPDEIQAEIDRTRNEMDATLSQIEHRLTPGQLIDQGIDYLKRSGARQYVTNLGGSVKDNPMPVTVAGIALAWLMVSANRPVQYKFVETHPDPAEPGAMDRAREGMDAARDTMSEGMQSARDSMSAGMQSARDSMQSTRERIGGTMSAARDRAHAMGESARYQAERARSGWDTLVREQPVALGAIGFAIGALVAAMAPRTRKEDELMGPARDRLMEQARQVGAEKVEQAKQAAGEAMNAVKQEAKPGGDSSTKPRVTPKADSQNPPSFVQHKAADSGPRNPS